MKAWNKFVVFWQLEEDLQNDDNANFEQKTYLIFANRKRRTIIHDKPFASKIVSLKIPVFHKSFDESSHTDNDTDHDSNVFDGDEEWG